MFTTWQCCFLTDNKNRNSLFLYLIQYENKKHIFAPEMTIFAQTIFLYSTLNEGKPVLLTTPVMAFCLAPGLACMTMVRQPVLSRDTGPVGTSGDSGVSLLWDFFWKANFESTLDIITGTHKLIVLCGSKYDEFHFDVTTSLNNIIQYRTLLLNIVYLVMVSAAHLFSVYYSTVYTCCCPH